MVKSGDKVKIHYTGKLTNQTVFDSSLERDPIEFTMGTGQIIEGFESGLVGMEVGDKKTITIDPDRGYGSVREDLIMTVPRSNVPKDVSIGSQLQTVGKNGSPISFVVREIKEEDVIVDANHPLAGQTLIFDVEVVDIG